MHQAYHGSSAAGTAAARVGYWDLVFANRIARFAAAVVILLAAATLVGEFGQMLSGGSVAWAEVTQHFQSVPFFYASIYMKDNTLARPEQFELWVGKGGYARMRVGTQVIFGKDGKVTRAFDITRRRETEPNSDAVDLLERLDPAGGYSIETVIGFISEGRLLDVTPLMNTDATIREDLVVFDVQSDTHPVWARIYALRKSRLPVGLRIWDPGEGFSVDALIAYAREQSTLFFDPQAFAKKLSEPGQTEMNLAYLFLKDPGGQDITPRDLADQDRQGP
jgi:hypothetical protein